MNISNKAGPGARQGVLMVAIFLSGVSGPAAAQGGMGNGTLPGDRRNDRSAAGQDGSDFAKPGGAS